MWITQLFLFVLLLVKLFATQLNLFSVKKCIEKTNSKVNILTKLILPIGKAKLPHPIFHLFATMQISCSGVSFLTQKIKGTGSQQPSFSRYLKYSYSILQEPYFLFYSRAYSSYNKLKHIPLT